MCGAGTIDPQLHVLLFAEIWDGARATFKAYAGLDIGTAESKIVNAVLCLIFVTPGFESALQWAHDISRASGAFWSR